MKQVLILFEKEGHEEQMPFKNTKYQPCYEDLYDLGNQHGLIFFRAPYQWYNRKAKTFTHAWTFKNKLWLKVKNIKPDTIYDKAKTSPESILFKENLKNDFKIINDLEFTSLISNKLYSSLIFSKYFKKYYLINNAGDLKKYAKDLKENRIVLKPIHGSGGNEIEIIGKKDISSVKIKKPVLAQEFVDSSRGILGITKETHDLRLVFINDELIYSYVRNPKKGSLLANLAQGGSMFTVDNKKIPPSVISIVKEVQEKFQIFYPKIYTIDFIFDKNQRPWIIELNSMPGLYFSPDQKKQMRKMYLGLIKVLK